MPSPKTTAPPPPPKRKIPQPEPEPILDPEPELESAPLDFASTLQQLRLNVDPKLVKQREGWRDRNGNVQMVDYVEWHTVADMLDDLAPAWSHTVKDIKEIGDIMTVTVAITIDGITREGIGTGNAHNEMGIKKAEHDALKRAAVKFGIARSLYHKESDIIERQGQTYDQGNDQGFPNQPVAKNLGDLVTAKQLGMIRALAREARVDADEECHSVMQCRSDELTKKAASSFIKYLQGGRQSIDRPTAEDRRLQDAPPLRQPNSRPNNDEIVNTKTKNTIRMTLHNLGANEAEWANNYSNGRTEKVDDLSQDEADSLLQDAESYPADSQNDLRPNR